MKKSQFRTIHADMLERAKCLVDEVDNEAPKTTMMYALGYAAAVLDLVSQVAEAELEES